MKIKGSVISGTKEGAYFMSQDVYTNQFKDKIGFNPFPGTLNIQVDEEKALKVCDTLKDHMGTIKGSKNFGDVKFIKATLNYKIKGALVFPVKTHHSTEILEFIAPDNLRKSLNLKDGDDVFIMIQIK